MRGLSVIVALVLWLLGSFHCALEAAGIDGALVAGHQHCDHPAPDETHPDDDDADTTVTSAGANVRGPALLAIALVAECPVITQLRIAVVPADEDDRPWLLARTWRFAQRAAWPARAPGVLS